MRIEAYNQIAQVYSASKATGTKSAGKVGAARKDEVQLSSIGKDIQTAKQAVAEASDIRDDKVAEIKAKYANGNVSVDTGDFASVLLSKYQQSL
jgi:negative regulator of flagellin synthesis FlgM